MFNAENGRKQAIQMYESIKAHDVSWWYSDWMGVNATEAWEREILEQLNHNEYDATDLMAWLASFYDDKEDFIWLFCDGCVYAMANRFDDMYINELED